MEKRKKFSKLVAFRLFEEEKANVKKVVRYKKDHFGFRLYESESHFIRCAIIKLLRNDLNNLIITGKKDKK